MYQHENLWIKISDDFHAEINPLLEQLNPDAINHYWFKKKSVQGKFYIINDMLLSLNGTGTNQYSLLKLKHSLEAYKTRIKSYFDIHDIATCFVFFSPKNYSEIINGLRNYYISFRKEISYGYLYLFGIELRGSPNDCSLKLTAKIINEKIIIYISCSPFFDIEKEKAKTKKNAIQKFTRFADETHIKIKELFENFDRCINLCNTIIDKQQKDTTPANLTEIKKIYSVLKNGYIQEPFELFTAIFQPEYSGHKIVWLKSGPELKYFVDRLNDKLKLSNTINKWTDSRVKYKDVTNLATYLSKQTTGEYDLLKKGLLPKNPIYKLFRE